MEKEKGGKAMKERIKGFSKDYAAFIAMLIIIAAASLLFDNFFSVNNFNNLFKRASIIGIMAIGEAFVILTGSIDLSVGYQCGFASIIAAMIGAATGNMALMIVVPVIVGAFWGMLNGFCVTKLRVQPFIVTLAAMSCINGVGLLITDGGNSIGIEHDLFNRMETESIGILPVSAVIMLAVVLTAAMASKYLRFGRYCYAIGGNEDSAIMKGIPVDRIKFLTYVLSGMCSALAGVVMAARTHSGNILLGEGYEMNALAAAVLGGILLSGGRGKVINSMWGAIIIMIIGNIINLNKNIPYQWEGCVTGGILLLILIAQSVITRVSKAEA